jgi:hypothetical protein
MSMVPVLQRAVRQLGNYNFGSVQNGISGQIAYSLSKSWADIEALQ